MNQELELLETVHESWSDNTPKRVVVYQQDIHCHLLGLDTRISLPLETGCGNLHRTKPLSESRQDILISDHFLSRFQRTKNERLWFFKLNIAKLKFSACNTWIWIWIQVLDVLELGSLRCHNQRSMMLFGESTTPTPLSSQLSCLFGNASPAMRPFKSISSFYRKGNNEYRDSEIASSSYLTNNNSNTTTINHPHCDNSKQVYSALVTLVEITLVIVIMRNKNKSKYYDTVHHHNIILYHEKDYSSLEHRDSIISLLRSI
ncbi:hypothetical protein BDA99DRAFT_582928 [Phascolomyces articulosus]|uniref:Uncharacterized protein n=1 Tax=Phascolomyces articulosus TaxID=60185 RepID=A0AAD5K7K6_9FUNG|nr:hypothetical protein BDA99DRAFT_582928 [Phascolomyces articulosus]